VAVLRFDVKPDLAEKTKQPKFSKLSAKRIKKHRALGSVFSLFLTVLFRQA